jgi:peptidoglycan/LPS O-acetylase OafA/YrhL
LILLVLGTAKNQFQMLGLVTVLFGCLVYLLSITNGVISRILASTPMQVLGGASYAIYLLQDPIREWVRIMVPSSNIGQFLNPVILITFSVAAFYWIEKPAREVILSFRRETKVAY